MRKNLIAFLGLLAVLGVATADGGISLDRDGGLQLAQIKDKSKKDAQRKLKAHPKAFGKGSCGKGQIWDLRTKSCM